MIDKRFLAIILALGLILSIGNATSQPRATLLEKLHQSNAVTKPTSGTESTTDAGQTYEIGSPTGTCILTFTIEEYQVAQNTLSSPTVAEILCFSGELNVVTIVFLDDDAPIQQNVVSTIKTMSSQLYYPYSRYNDILAILEKGNAEFCGDPAHPEAASIRSEAHPA